MPNPTSRSLFTKIPYIIKVSRPIFWLFITLPFAIGLTLNWSNNVNLYLIILQFLSLTLPLNWWAYGINDWYDTESDINNPRKGGSQGVKSIRDNFSLSEFRNISIVNIFLVLGISLLTFNWLNIASTTSLIALSYIYSAPPVRLKSRIMVDSLSNGLMILFFPALMGFSIGGGDKSIPITLYLVILAIAGMHSFWTIQDIEFDKLQGDKTTGTVLGTRLTAIWSFVLALPVVIFFPRTDIQIALACSSIIFLLPALAPKSRLSKISPILIAYSWVLLSIYFLVRALIK